MQREVVSTLWKEAVEEQKRLEREKEKKEKEDLEKGENPSRSASVAPEPPDDDDELFANANDAMRKTMMEMQGMRYGNLTPKQKEEQKKEAKKRSKASKQVDDDYLVGPISIDSYVMFRVRLSCCFWLLQLKNPNQ